MKVLLGVTGCIAAYKSCEILRELQKRDVDVEVVLTKHALEFVGAQTFSALSGHPARYDNFGDDAYPIPHITLAEECDLFLIAPCTANVLSKIACGIADDLLTSCALVAHDKLAIAPAMNVNMYNSPSTQANIKTLSERGVIVLEPDSGYLACGDIGKGRLADPDIIAKAAIRLIEGNDRMDARDLEGDGSVHPRDLEGKKVLVTAGPTRERIDPVRFITNDSSGKMGIAIANAAHRRGADVTLALGPVAIDPDDGINVIPIETSKDLLEAVQAAPNFDIGIFSAAVCDIKPKQAFERKLKKGIDDEALNLIPTEDTVDVLKTYSEKNASTYIIGFAAETNDVVENGKEKLASKGADMIVANEVGVGKTFGMDESKAWLIASDDVIELNEMPKEELANVILDEACANMS